MEELGTGPVDSCRYADFYQMLEDLNSRALTGNDALRQVLAFIYLPQYYPYKDAIVGVLSRDLKARVDASLINKVFPGCVPVFKVALAHSYKDFKDKVNFIQDTWLYSRKLDGQRLLLVVDGDSITCYTRKGEEFTTLDVLKDHLRSILPKGTKAVFDGELCIVDPNGLEHFSDIARVASRKAFTIPNPRYYVFDVLTLDEFYEGSSTAILSERLKRFEKLIGKSTSIITLLEQSIAFSDEQVIEYFKKLVAEGCEGLILRKDVGYKATRSSDMLKVKEFMDGEYIVQNAIMGKKRMITDGVEQERDVLSSVTILHKGYEVSVGSGFSDSQRQLYFNHPDLIIGRTITVQYFSETENLNGTVSLRFPIIKHIYDEQGRTA